MPQELQEFVQRCPASWERQDSLWGLPVPFTLPHADLGKEALAPEMTPCGRKAVTCWSCV